MSGAPPKQRRGKKGQFLPAEQHSEEAVKQAVERYVAGDSVQDIAQTFKVDRGIIYDWMLADLGPQKYEGLVTRVLVSRVRRADQMLEEAETPHHIARAREIARFARMDLERRRPHLYGPKQEVRVDMNVNLADRLIRARERTIDAQVIDVAPQPLQGSTDITDQPDQSTGS